MYNIDKVIDGTLQALTLAELVLVLAGWRSRLGLVVLLLLDLEAVPHVRGDVGTFLAFLLGLEPSDGKLSCCCCSPQSTAAALMELQVIVQTEAHAQYRNIITLFPCSGGVPTTHPLSNQLILEKQFLCEKYNELR